RSPQLLLFGKCGTVGIAEGVDEGGCGCHQFHAPSAAILRSLNTSGAQDGCSRSADLERRQKVQAVTEAMGLKKKRIGISGGSDMGSMEPPPRIESLLVIGQITPPAFEQVVADELIGRIIVLTTAAGDVRRASLHAPRVEAW